MSESGIMRRIMVALSALPGCRVFRNNVGQGWVGQLASKAGGARVTLVNARPLHAGLFVGSSDLIGWTTVEVTPAMIGQRIAIFTSLEVKDEGGCTQPEQTAWLNAVRAAGGIACIVRSEQDALYAVRSL